MQKLERILAATVRLEVKCSKRTDHKKPLFNQGFTQFARFLNLQCSCSFSGEKHLLTSKMMEFCFLKFFVPKR